MSKGFILKALVVKKLELKFISMGLLPPVGPDFYSGKTIFGRCAHVYRKLMVLALISMGFE